MFILYIYNTCHYNKIHLLTITESVKHLLIHGLVITSISILKQRKMEQVNASLDYSQSGLASCMLARSVSVGLF